MRIGHIELFVCDVAQAKAFYLDVLGAELVADQGQTVWVKLGEVELLLRGGLTHSFFPERYQTAAYGLALYTENLDQTAAELQARGLAFKGDDGPGCLTFTDPDGHWFQLVNPEHA